MSLNRDAPGGARASLIDRLVPWRLRSFNNFVLASPNRFFTGVLRTPPCVVQPDAAVCVHALVCKRDVNMMITSAKSLLRFCPPVALVLHDDGSLDESDSRVLHHHFPGVRVIRRADADAALRSVLPADVMALRMQHVLVAKVLDVSYFARGTHTIVMDADLLFLRSPVEVVDWMRQELPPPFYNQDPMPTYRASKPSGHGVPPSHLNSGFIGFARTIPLDEVVATARAIDYWLEDQTLYAALLAGDKPQALDRERYRVYLGESITERTAMVHFISPKRFERLLYPRLASRVHRELRRAAPAGR